MLKRQHIVCVLWGTIFELYQDGEPLKLYRPDHYQILALQAKYERWSGPPANHLVLISQLFLQGIKHGTHGSPPPHLKGSDWPKVSFMAE